MFLDPSHQVFIRCSRQIDDMTFDGLGHKAMQDRIVPIRKGIRFIQDQQIKSLSKAIQLMGRGHDEIPVEVVRMAFAHDDDFESRKGVPEAVDQL